jgi:hypothetical protein
LHSKITILKSRDYVDEILDVPFKKYKFELQYGILGKLFEGYACGQLQKTFGYRRIATTKALENN